jgi:branched-chain amino acid transport system substrate-binding protein
VKVSDWWKYVGARVSNKNWEGEVMKKIFISAIIVGMISVGLAGNGSAQPVKIGAVINLTGPASSWGQYHAKGHQDYIKYVNEVRGGIAGRKLELTIVDHAYKVPDGVKYVKKFCEDKMDTIATWDAGTGIQIKPIIQEYKIPTINYSTYQGILTPPIGYIYLPFGSYVLDSYAVLEYIKAIHKGKDAPKVGLLTYNNVYGKSIHDPSKEYAAKNNINIVSIEEFPPATVDLSTELLRLKQKGAEYLFVQILPAGIITALKAADRNNYNVPFFGTWTATDPDFFKLGQGLIGNRLFMQFCGVLPGDKTPKGEKMPGIELMERLWARYKTVSSFETSYWEGVVVAMIQERAIHRASGLYKTINAETINRAMETFQNEDFGGLVPYVTYNKDYHEGSFKGRIVQIHENATYTPLTTFFDPEKEKIQVLKVPEIKK